MPGLFINEKRQKKISVALLISVTGVLVMMENSVKWKVSGLYINEKPLYLSLLTFFTFNVESFVYHVII